MSEANPFRFDDEIVFNASRHSYLVRGVSRPPSVTSIVKRAFPEQAAFDGPKIIKKNLASWQSNASSKYHGTVKGLSEAEAVDAVLQLWEKNRNAGTQLHAEIEALLNGDEKTLDRSAELKHFLDWYDQKLLAGWTAVRTELPVFYAQESGSIAAAGMIDAVFRDNTGLLRVIDFKRTDKSLDPKEYSFGRVGSGVAKGLLDNDGTRYSLQVWLYSLMLKQCTGCSVGAPLILQLHEENSSAVEHSALYCEEEARLLLEA